MRRHLGVARAVSHPERMRQKRSNAVGEAVSLRGLIESGGDDEDFDRLVGWDGGRRFVELKGGVIVGIVAVRVRVGVGGGKRDELKGWDDIGLNSFLDRIGLGDEIFPH